MKKIINTSLLIIGSGPVGLFGAFQAGMLKIDCSIIEANNIIGGQCNLLYPEKYIYDIPGLYKVSGNELITNLQQQANRFDVKYYLNTRAISSIFDTEKEIFITDTDNNIFHSKAIIICSGSGLITPNKLPISNACDFEEKTLFYSVKDKSIFQNQKIIITGGGDSAIDWIFELADIAKNISLVHRRDIFKSMPFKDDNLKKLQENNILNINTPYKIEELIGNNGSLQKIRIKNMENDSIKELDCDYLLTFFGLTTNNSYLINSNIKTKLNMIEVNIETMETNISGIFAAGDACGYPNKLKLILCGFTEVTTAVYSAYRSIFNKKPHFQHSTDCLS